MRRTLALLLALLTLLSGCGSTETPSGSSSVTFYYSVRDADTLENGDTAVSGETRTVEASSLISLLERYLAGPESENLISPFPDGTVVLSVSEAEDALSLTLSDSFFSLSGVELSIACCCLSRTVCEYTGRTGITVLNSQESVRMELTPDTYLLSDTFFSDSDQVFTLYFPQEDQRYVVSELREATLSDNETRESYLLRELLSGPESGSTRPAVPDGTEVLEVSTSGGICSVSLSSEFFDGRFDDTYGAYTTIYSIVNTLTELDAVDAVLFLREGESVDYYGVFPLSAPVERDTRVIGPVHTGSGELDMDFHMLTLEEDQFFAVPVRVKQTISEPAAEAVLRALLDYDPPQGFYSPIPIGTELLSVSVSGSICYVDVSQEFIPQEDSEFAERAAVWTLVTTLTELDSVSSVLLTIEGESSGLQYVDLTEPLDEHMELES